MWSPTLQMSWQVFSRRVEGLLTAPVQHDGFSGKPIYNSRLQRALYPPPPE